MASAAKKIKTQAGTAVRTPAAGASASAHPPVSLQTLADSVLQLQNTVNEVISRLNAHTHSTGAVAAPDAATRVQGTAVAATNLFTDN